MKITNFLWTIPFLCFLGTYIALSFFFTKPTIHAPVLIGKQLSDAFSLLSAHNLNPRLLREQIDDDLPAGTILSQVPTAGQKIKPHQQIFITVSKKTKKLPAPQLVGKWYDRITEQLNTTGIKHKVYYLQSKKPKGSVIAQIPQAHTPLPNNRMILYVSDTNNKPIIFPDFTQQTVQQINQFLAAYDIKPRIYHARAIKKDHECSSCRVIEQRPLPGSIIDLQKPLSVQLKVTT